MFKKGKTRVYFNSTSIIRALVRQIKSSDRVCGCIAWLTHPKLLDELEAIESEIIMTRHKCNKFKRRIKVKFLGKGRGRKKSLMHHKFAVGFKSAKSTKPSWVCTGSFNWTKSATRHHENLILITDEDVAQTYYEEFLRLKAL
jgi:phosphatidylserine/phosphatidylglycerophosphate/cardiolipin synthase-like enzyme